MTQVSVAEAAKLCGKDRKTLYRYIKQGKLSATTDATGGQQVDVAELIRVFGALRQVGDTGDSGATVAMPQVETPQKDSKIKELEAEIETLRDKLRDKESHIDDLRQVVRLLGHEKPKGWLRRLFG